MVTTTTNQREKVRALSVALRKQSRAVQMAVDESGDDSAVISAIAALTALVERLLSAVLELSGSPPDEGGDLVDLVDPALQFSVGNRQRLLSAAEAEILAERLVPGSHS